MVDLEDEVWKDVVGYEELFSVSNRGRLFSKRTNKILKQNIVGNGYNACVTKLNGRKGSNLVMKIHREVGARALARNYGVCKATILSIVHGESYLDVV